MQLDFNDDQGAFLNGLDQILADPAGRFRPAPDWGRWDHGAALDAMLDSAGYLDAGREESLGTVAAAELVIRVAALPVAVESAASALLRPALGLDLPRPLAVIDGDAGAVAFAAQARAVLWFDGARLRAAPLPPAAVQPVETVFACPMGAIDTDAVPDWQDCPLPVAQARALWQVAQAAELTGALTGGLESVLAHVRTRHQFGRPLGSFQAVQHRLAAAAVQIDAARWMVLRAAQTGTGADALLALGQAQAMAPPIIRDLHQFMGAMGLTLEHPLHRFTYRARMLRAAGGGASASLRAYADQRWGVA